MTKLILSLTAATLTLSTPCARAQAGPEKSTVREICQTLLDGAQSLIDRARMKRDTFRAEHGEDIARERAKIIRRLAEVRAGARDRWAKLLAMAPPQVREDLLRLKDVFDGSLGLKMGWRGQVVREQTASFLDVVRAAFGAPDRRARVNRGTLSQMDRAGFLASGRVSELAQRVVNSRDEWVVHQIERLAPHLRNTFGVRVMEITAPVLLFDTHRRVPSWHAVGEVVILVDDFLVAAG